MHKSDMKREKAYRRKQRKNKIDADRLACSLNKMCSEAKKSIINEMFPIKMPYMPSKPIEVVCTDFLFDKANGDFDTVGIHYCIKEENGKKVTIPINRYFKEDEKADWIEIDEEEYSERYSKRIINDADKKED